MKLDLGSRHRSLVKGFAAGLIAGLAGSAVKSVGEMIYNPRTEGQTPPPAILAERVAGHPLSKQKKNAATQIIHYGFGSLTGGVYGAAAELVPWVTVGSGAVFGAVLQLLTHESLVPAAGLDVPAPRQPAREHLSELSTHVLYGISTEAVRRAIRPRL